MSVAYKKILVPLDGSTLAAQALPHALALVELHQAEIILFRVIHEPHFVAEYVTEGKLQVDQHREQAMNEATIALTELAAELKLRQFKVTPVIEVGLPAEAIIDYAGKHTVSLIVMSTHGRTGLARWVYGSVADKVLRDAPCPVLLIRAALD